MRFEFVIHRDGYYKQCTSTDLKTMVFVLNQSDGSALMVILQAM